MLLDEATLELIILKCAQEDVTTTLHNEIMLGLVVLKGA
jgi:hypothetical protein